MHGRENTLRAQRVAVAAALVVASVPAAAVAAQQSDFQQALGTPILCASAEGDGTSALWWRLAGDGRYDTMGKIVSKGFAESSVAVVASGARFPDALSASALAGALSCPVILTDGNALSPEAASLFLTLGVHDVYLMGGEGAVSSAVESEIASLGIGVTRVAGADRTSTSVEAMLWTRGMNTSSDTVIVATGSDFADSLSIGPYAWATASPIVLTSASGRLSAEAVSAIYSDTGITHVLLLGGTASVSDDVMSQLGDEFTYERLGGQSRYETSALIASWTASTQMGWSTVALAGGQSFPDALAGSSFVGSRGGVLLLVSATDGSAATTLSQHAGGISNVFVLGGEGSVSSSTVEGIRSSIR